MENSLEDLMSKQVERVFLYKEFEKICPYFISIGMTYSEFWNEDVEKARYYNKAYQMKEKREALKQKWALWEQGLYIYEALCDVSPVIRAFSKATKPLQYPKEPYGIDKIQKEFRGKEEESRYDKERKKLEIIKTQIFFENWAKATKDRFRKKGDNDGK